MSEICELVINKEDYLEFLAQRLRLRGSCQREIENVSFPFLFASGSEMLRTYILGTSEFTSTLAGQIQASRSGIHLVPFLSVGERDSSHARPDDNKIRASGRIPQAFPAVLPLEHQSSDPRSLSDAPSGPGCPGLPLPLQTEALVASQRGAFRAGA